MDYPQTHCTPYLTLLSPGALDKWRCWAPSSLFLGFQFRGFGFLLLLLVFHFYLLCCALRSCNQYLLFMSIGDGKLWESTIFVWICLRKHLPFKAVWIVLFCHPYISWIVHHPLCRHPPISMRKKKTSHNANDVPPKQMSTGIDMDPVNNNQLCDDVWNRLRDWLKNVPNEGTAL